MTYVRESSVESLFVRRAKEHGWVVRKLQWVGRRHAPDRVMLGEGARIVFIELKAPQGRLHPGQQREHARLRALGFRVAVLWNKEEVERYFE